MRAIRQARERIAQGFAARVFLRFSQTPYFGLREADLAQEHQGEAQQGGQEEHSLGLQQAHVVQQPRVAADHQAIQQGKMKQTRDIGGHREQEHQGAEDPGAGADHLDYGRGKQNAGIPQGQKAEKPCRAELGSGDGEDQEGQNGQRDDQSSLYPCQWPGKMSTVEHEEHHVEQDEIDS